MLKTLSRLAILACCSSSSILAQGLQNTSERLKVESRPAINWKDPDLFNVETYAFQSVVERMLGLRDLQAKTLGTARLGDVIWQYDETRGRELFQKALGLIPDRTAESSDAVSLRRLRQKVVVLVAKHDRVWAKRVIDRISAEEVQGGSENNIAVAEALAKDDPDAAVDFAQRALVRRLEPSFISLLQQLKTANPNHADQLFVQALAAVGRQPTPNISDLVVLGTYLFTSPKAGPDPTSIVFTRVGNIGIADITMERTGTPPELIQAYLATGVGILSRPIPDPRERQVGYAFGHLLAPKVQVYTPNLLPQLSVTMTALSANVPLEMRQESAFANLKKVRPDDFELMSIAEKSADANTRDITYLDVAFHAWLRKDFQTARLAAERISQISVASSLRTLIDFGEGSIVLKRAGRSVAAETIASRLPLGIERSVLFLGISHQAEEAGDRDAALQSATLAAQAARSISDARKPFVLLMAAGRLARLHDAAAHSVLTEAISSFNKQTDLDLQKVSWEQRVEIGPLVEKFPLAVKGVDFDFSSAFSAATSGILDEGMAAATALTNESLKARAFVEIARQILRNEAFSQTKPRVVRVEEDGIRKSASKTVMPDYPEKAVKEGKQGVAVVELEYDGQGVVTEVKVIEAPTDTIGRAVVSAVKQWRFRTSSYKGEPLAVRGKLTFYFVLDSDGKPRVENPKQFR